MAQQVALTNWEKTINDVESEFLKFADKSVFAKESMFAIQMCKNNSYLASIADKDSSSLKMAIINLAALHLTLNPQQKLAYLVPRQGKVILDISYQGLKHIAIASGAIKNVIAENVYANDKFVYLGRFQKPEHVFNPFAKISDRGEIIGCYSISFMNDDSIIVDTLSLEEIEKIRSSSELYNKTKSGPWVDWFERMTLKTMIKRAESNWPRNEIVSKAVALTNESGEGLDPSSMTLIVESNSSNNQQENANSDKVDDYAVSFVKKVIDRLSAKESTVTVSAARDLLSERLHDKNLAYGLNMLDEYEKNIKSENQPSGEAGNNLVKEKTDSKPETGKTVKEDAVKTENENDSKGKKTEVKVETVSKE